MDLNSYISWLQSEEWVDASEAAVFYSFAEFQIRQGYGDSVIFGEAFSGGTKEVTFNYPDTLKVLGVQAYNEHVDRWSQCRFSYFSQGYFWFEITAPGFFALILDDQYPDYIDAYYQFDDLNIMYPDAPLVQHLPTPTGLYADNITSDSATIGWNAVENATNYKVEYRRQGDTTWNE